MKFTPALTILQKAALLFFVTSVFSFLTFNSTAQSKDSITISSLIKKKPFNYKNGNFQGEGWDMLQKEIEKVQFLMIGEQHGEAEIPVFTGKIASFFKPKAFVAEIDPYFAKRLKKIAPHPEAYADHFKKWPYDFAFYSWETEMALVKQLVAEQVDIWGLNEITFMSAGLFFEELAATAKIPANKAIALKKSVECQKHDELLYTDSDKFSELSFAKLTIGYIDTLQRIFKNDNQQSKKMIRDLKASRILLGGEKYTMRVEMMKKNLLNYVSPYVGKDSIDIPKLLFKFGANHLTRTNDVTNRFEVGSFADHLAAAGGKKTLHLLVFGKSGTYNTMLSTDNAKSVQPYNIVDDKDLEMFKPFYSQIGDQEWAVFDLKPLRLALIQGKLSGSNPGINDFIKGYDLLVLFSPVTGNKFIK